jgi:monofunctional biosynthetic peptidoglycan transglycosylase
MKLKPKSLFSLVLILGGVMVLGFIFYTLYLKILPDVLALKSLYPHIHYQGKGKPPLVELKKQKPPGWIHFNQVSREAIGAIIVSEDWAFYGHKGYDPNQIKIAFQESLDEGKLVRGASTITQQVVKNIFLSRDKTLIRKIRELILAIRLEQSFSKTKILEQYLNIAEWGEGIYGIRHASSFYFKKSPIELNAKEGAFLALLLPSPKRYSQSFRQHQLTRYANRTLNSILFKMKQAHFLSEDRYDQIKSDPLWFETNTSGSETESDTEEDEL